MDNITCTYCKQASFTITITLAANPFSELSDQKETVFVTGVQRQAVSDYCLDNQLYPLKHMMICLEVRNEVNRFEIFVFITGTRCKTGKAETKIFLSCSSSRKQLCQDNKLQSSYCHIVSRLATFWLNIMYLNTTPILSSKTRFKNQGQLAGSNCCENL